MSTSDDAARNDFAPTAPWAHLRLRAQLLRRLRTFFEQRGFLEVETPLLSADTVVDRYLDPLGVTLPDDPRAPDVGRPMWLQTSPEFAMKRLLAAGAEAIYQVTRAFRAAERGALHNVEFTIVEWYRRGDSMDDAMECLSELVDELLGTGPAQRQSYAEAFLQLAGLNPHTATTTALAGAVARLDIVASESLDKDDRDGWLDLLLVHRVAPHLGQDRPTILYDYPSTQAALAQVSDEPVPVAKRFELFVAGIELANGYVELLDPQTLRRRNAEANRQRTDDERPRLPEKSRLLTAMHHGLPDCCGVALGFDRVVMLAAGAKSLAEVMAFPIDRA